MKLFKVTNEQLQSLQAGNSITKDGKIYTYDETAFYVIVNPPIINYTLSASGRETHLKNNNDVVSSLIIPYAQQSGTAGSAQKVEDSHGNYLSLSQLITYDEISTYTN